MNIIEITSQNHQEFKGLDVVAFSLAHAGAQGEGGGINIITSDGKLYHTNIVRSIEIGEAFAVLPCLKDCYFHPIHTTVPEGWSHFYMGAGNFIVVREEFKKLFTSLEPFEIYRQWKDIVSKSL